MGIPSRSNVANFWFRFESNTSICHDLTSTFGKQTASTFPEKSSLHSVVKNQALQKTMLTEFFSMNKYDNYAKNLNCVYAQFPEYFRWNQQSKIWEQHKQREVIGRILGAHPSEGERYYLRILLMHVRKPTSFTDLRTVNGRVCASFHEAADIMGLLQTDNAAELCLSEAVV